MTTSQVHIVGGLDYYIPFFDRASGLILYDHSTGVLFTDDVGGHGIYTPDIVTYSHLNQKNPDWVHLGPESLIEGPFFVEGNGHIPSGGLLIGCSVQVLDSFFSVDRWWMTSDIGKYGAIRPWYGGQTGSLHFVNGLNTLVDFTRIQAPNGIDYAFQPNVIGIIYMLRRVTYPLVQYGFGSPAASYPNPTGVI